MKNLVTMTIAAAALMTAAGVASAQTMEAKIPFAFRTSGKVLAPGTYRVQLTRIASGAVLEISQFRSDQQALAVPYPSGSPAAAWKKAGKAVLSFDCGSSGCSLHSVWMGNELVYELPHAKRSKLEVERAELVVMYPVKSE